MRAINVPEPEYFRYKRELAKRVSALTSGQCATGPFKGMWVYPDPVWEDGNLASKYIGSYEHELHGVIEEAITRNPATVVNIGCAEGYYTVGMARRLLRAEILAYDLDEKSLKLCMAAAIRNGVHNRIVFSEGCRELPKIPKNSLIIMDCEGDERYLLDLYKYPILKTCDILVECHDFVDARISYRLVSHYLDTHEMRRIDPKTPNPQEYSFLHSLSIGSQLEAMTELRPDNTAWLWMKCR